MIVYILYDSYFIHFIFLSDLLWNDNLVFRIALLDETDIMFLYVLH